MVVRGRSRVFQEAQLKTQDRKIELLEDRTVPALVLAGDQLEAWDRAANYSAPSQHLININGFLSGRQTGDPASIAVRYLHDHATQLGLSAADVGHYVVTDFYTDQDAVATSHLYLQQTFNGLTVANANLNVNVSRFGQVINLGSTFYGGLSAWETYPNVVPTPGISSIEAVADTATHLEYRLTAAPTVTSSTVGLDQRQTLVATGVSQIPIPARLTYIVMPDGAHLTWNLSLQTPDNQHWYDAFADANTGELLYLSDWSDNASYQVYPIPLESPSEGARQTVVDPANATASPFGWHDTDGVAGAEFTDTQGNNVNAQEDVDANNTGGFRPNGGAGLDFSFPIDLTQAPITYQSASITNLFYWNNVLHDIHYQYGFTPAAGNFQTNNYGAGGLGNDAVFADSQDGTGTNNANFATPADGTAPRMQIYLFTAPNPDRDSDLDAGVIAHEYGHGVSHRLTGGPSNPNSLNAIQSGGMGEGWSDFFALMFTQKGTDTQNAAYPIGTYINNQPPTGGGIRRQPYSYNMAINNQTIGVYNTSNPETHANGELWCDALWDLNWLLINKYGYDSNLYTGYSPGGGPASAGNKLMMRLVLDGMKLQPALPSYMDARNAIFAADQVLTGGANKAEIWQAFARRGMGVSFIDPSANAFSLIEAFDVPAPFTLPLAAKGTLGSLVYSSTTTGMLLSAGAVDSYTLSLDAGQRASIVVSPINTVNSSLQPTVDFRDPANVQIGASTAIAQGAPTYLQGLALTTTGNYSINVSGNSSTVGGYTIRLILNTALENESQGGGTNNTTAAAQNIESQFTAIGGTGQVATVTATSDLGGTSALETENNDTTATANSLTNNFNAVNNNVYHLGIVAENTADVDVDTFNIGILQVGDILTFADSGASSSRGTNTNPVAYLFRAGSSSYINRDDDSGTGTDPMFYRVTVTVTDTYYIACYRFAAADSGTYQLGIYLENTGTAPSTGGTFTTETEPNNTTATANDASTSWRAVQYLSRSNGVIATLSDVDIYSATFQAGDLVSAYVKSQSGLDARLSLLDSVGTPIAVDAGDSGLVYDASTYGYIIPAAGTYYFSVAAATGSTVVGAYYLDVRLSSTTAPAAAPIVSDLYSFTLTAGQRISAALKNLTAGSISVDLLDAGGNLLASGVAGATNYDRTISNFAAPTTGVYFARVAGAGLVDYQLTVARGIALEREGNGSFALGNDISGSDGVLGYTSDDDFFRINLAAGQTIRLQTSTPGDGVGQFVNNLNPAIDFYSPAGALLATDDNSAPDGRNALLMRTATTAGLYGVRVRGVSATTGEYYLSADTTAPTITAVYIDGSLWTAAFRAAAGSANYGYPAQTGGGQLTTLPWSTIDTVYVKFSENVAVDSADLGIRGLNVANYAIASFAYDNANFVAKWTLAAPIDTDRVIVDLDGDTLTAVADPSGNKLAGSWTESVSTFPTAGTAGNDFKYRFVVAVGDADRNGQVRNPDTNLVRANLFIDAGQAGYNIYADIDGNGQTRNADLNAVRSHLFIDPPAGPGPNRPVRDGAGGSRDRHAAQGGSRFLASRMIDQDRAGRTLRRMPVKPTVEVLDRLFEEI